MTAVVVDTSALSLLMRRAQPSRLTAAEASVRREVSRLATAGDLVLIGMVRQEVLSGIFNNQRFTAVRDALRAFRDHPVGPGDHERAAEMFTTCRRAGIQGSVVDYLVCAVAERLAGPVLASDVDFERYATVLSVRLHVIP